MARYIDADELCEGLTDMARYQDPYKQSTILGVVGTIKNTRTADVVPRAEVAREIFEEIEFDIHQLMFDREETRAIAIEGIIANLKKKYAGK